MRRFLLFMFSIFCCSATFGQTPATGGQEEYVTIWRVARNDFHRAEFPPNVFAGIMNSSPSKEVTIGKNETVSQKLRELFNISQTWTPAIYSSVLAEISKLNPNVNFNNLRPGTTVLVPELPLTGKSQPGNNPADRAPNLFAAKATDNYTWSERLARFVGDRPRVKAIAPAAQSELQYFRMPAKATKTYIDILRTFGEAAAKFGQSGKVKIALADQFPTLSQIDKIVPPTLADSIKSALTNAPQDSPRPVVIVLDDSISPATGKQGNITVSTGNATLLALQRGSLVAIDRVASRVCEDLKAHEIKGAFIAPANFESLVEKGVVDVIQLRSLHQAAVAGQAEFETLQMQVAGAAIAGALVTVGDLAGGIQAISTLFRSDFYRYHTQHKAGLVRAASGDDLRQRHHHLQRRRSAAD
jgi:hypothetical protein